MEKTPYLQLTVFPDITGVYQKDLREAYDANAALIDAAVKALADNLKEFSQKVPDKATDKSPGIVQPDGVTILIDENGVISAIASEIDVQIATTDKAGIVKPDGKSTTVDTDGTIHANVPDVNIATTSKAGIVRPDGTTITIDRNGVISVKGGGSYTKREIDAMFERMSDLFISDTDFTALYTATNKILNEKNKYSGLGASIMTVEDVINEIVR